MKIVPTYAALLAILFVVLSIRTIRARRRFQIGLGDAGNAQMLRAIGVHANFAEYAPLCLLLLFFVEERGASTWLVNALCLSLTIGRLSHAYGVSQANENFKFRVAGMVMTFITILSSSAYLLIKN
jgi:uncharacterized membrane protein YecN with MAPEG domain